MQLISILFLVVFCCFFISVIFLFLWKLIKKKKYLNLGLIAGVLLIPLSLLLVLNIISKSYYKASELFQSRTGIEVYSALLGTPKKDCINVLNFKDQTVPKLDAAIILYCSTCKIEVDRLIQRYDYKIDTLIDFNTEIISEQLSWFNQIKLRDTVILYRTVVKPGKQWQNLYLNTDKSMILIEDILD